MHEWLAEFNNQITSVDKGVRSCDSVSNVGHGSRVKTRSSVVSPRSKGGSSTLSDRLAVRAEKASLAAEKAELAKHQALQREELALRQKQRQQEEKLRLLKEI